MGEHDRETRMPLPDHIDARPEDLTSLIDGMIAFDNAAMRRRLDAVIAAAMLAFGFVYAATRSRMETGRIHRYLIHHVLAEGAASTRPALCSPFRPQSWTGSTTTGRCWKVIRGACCR